MEALLSCRQDYTTGRIQTLSGTWPLSMISAKLDESNVLYSCDRPASAFVRFGQASQGPLLKFDSTSVHFDISNDEHRKKFLLSFLS